MSEEVLHEKVSYIVDKVEDIESLITRRLLEDKAKNSLIEELKQYLIYRQDLDKGEKFAPFMKQILQVIDRIESSEEKSDLLTSIAEELLQKVAEIGRAHGISLEQMTNILKLFYEE